MQEPAQGGGVLVALPFSLQQLPLDSWAAQHGLNTLLAEAEDTRRCLAEANVLQETLDGQPFAQMSAYKRVFKDVVYVWVTGANPLLCTCRFFSLHAQCEHALFVRTQSWPCRKADLSFEDLPRKRKAQRTSSQPSAKRPRM